MTEFQPDTDQLLVERDDRIAVVTLNRPQARNARSDEVATALRGAIAWAGEDDSVGALVITGAGTAFCAGGDVKGMGRRNDDSPSPSLHEQYLALIDRHKAMAGALYRMRKPTLAALPGAAAGAGMSLALACDIRVASENAFLTTAYARVGLSGDYGVAWLLTRVVGPARARELLMSSERVQADKAERIGLVNRVTSPESLMSETLEFARLLAAGPPIAIRYIKDNLDEALSIDHDTAIEREADRLLKSRSTSDHREAVRAFAEKREPKFTGC